MHCALCVVSSYKKDQPLMPHLLQICIQTTPDSFVDVQSITRYVKNTLKQKLTFHLISHYFFVQYLQQSPFHKKEVKHSVTALCIFISQPNEYIHLSLSLHSSGFIKHSSKCTFCFDKLQQRSSLKFQFHLE